MRKRLVRGVFLGLVLAFPILIVAVAPQPSRPTSRATQSMWPVIGAECLVVLGFVYAGGERRRCLEVREMEVRTPLPSRPHSRERSATVGVGQTRTRAFETPRTPG